MLTPILGYYRTAYASFAAIYGGPKADKITSMALDSSNNNTFITGYFTSSMKMGTNFFATAGTFTGMVLARLDSSNNVQWAIRATSNNGNVYGNALALNGTSIYMVGTFNGTINFYGTDASVRTTTAVGMQDCFVAKYNLYFTFFHTQP